MIQSEEVMYCVHALAYLYQRVTESKCEHEDDNDINNNDYKRSGKSKNLIDRGINNL